MSDTRVDGRYALEREIGRGANGAVWLAQDELLHRQVAVKRVGLLQGAAGDPDRAGREARLAARVNHPHVVSVYDLVRTDDALWLVMEYVDGRSLSAMVRDAGPLAPDDAAQLLAPVADALLAAHQHGVVHRDVKPSNILVNGAGQAKLSDFGIARGDQDATLTQTGMVTGSPAYLAPEVAIGAQASPASDVWAFGATLVHVLTGKPPYHRDDAENGPLAVVYRIVHGDPPRPIEAGWLGPLIEMTMTADPLARPSMQAVRDHLSRATDLVLEQTAQMPAVPAPVAQAPAVQAPSVQAPVTPPPPFAPTPPRVVDAPGPGNRRTAALFGAVVLVAAALITTFVLIGLGDDEGPRTANDAPTSASPTETAATAPTATELEEFARNYVLTADANPAEGFKLLTPDYQAKSTGYDDFWGPLRSPKISEISADPAAMTVTYTYSYTFPGKGRETEQVTLELEERDGTLLIAGDR